jgi:catechol 2,3-dioxygenase-like lactoylglutathione lyase family enzyme
MMEMSDRYQNQELQGNALRAICSFYVPVRNPLKSAEWWQRNFGLEYAVPYNPAENSVILKLSEGQWMHLMETEGLIDNQFPVKGGYEMFRFTFDVTQIEVLHDRLKSNGVRIEELRDRDSCGINFVFFDPDGNKFDVNEVVRVSRTPEEAKKLREHLFSVV